MQQQLAGTSCCPSQIGSKVRDGERGVDARGATFRSQLSSDQYSRSPRAAQRPALRDLARMREQRVQSENVGFNPDCIAERLLKGE
ncbi:hypothetical protein LX32DRAFT_574290, partial [Colletotrichum zoysiae]